MKVLKLASFSIYSGCDKNDPQSRIRTENNLHSRDRRQGDQDGGQVKTRSEGLYV